MTHEESFLEEMQKKGFREDIDLENQMSSILRKYALLPAILALVSMTVILIKVFNGAVGYDSTVRWLALIFVVSMGMLFYAAKISLQKLKDVLKLEVRTIALGQGRNATALVDHSKSRFYLMRYWKIL